MVKIDNHIDRTIGLQLLALNNEERAKHKSSGKLSASSLGLPLQWQILKALGVQGRDMDEYTLRKFARGKHVEDWVMQSINPIVTQEFVQYKTAIGCLDAMCDTSGWDFKCGVIPVEVKSVANMKFKRILRSGADTGHKLQGAFYALAKGTDNFAVMYVASDDLRVHTYILETSEFKAVIDEKIAVFENALTLAKEKGIVPVFQEIETWHKNLAYNNYPDWMGLTQEECNKKYAEIKAMQIKKQYATKKL